MTGFGPGSDEVDAFAALIGDYRVPPDVSGKRVFAAAEGDVSEFHGRLEFCGYVIGVADIDMEMFCISWGAVGGEVYQIDVAHFRARFDPIKNSIRIYFRGVEGPSAATVALGKPAPSQT